MVAVSGGVDSVALLHMLAQMPGLQLTVAHFDHGIRPDSADDRKFVQKLAQRYDLPFVYHEGKLGSQASEAAARKARYQFLHETRQASGAEAIITAHHQDDLLETMILNLLRGTGPRGLSSLKSTGTVMRPLLHVSKKELLRYAREQGLEWHEDSTNASERYLRNYIRKNILPRFADKDRERMLAINRRAHELRSEIALLVDDYLRAQPEPYVLDRHSFIMLPHAVAREVMAQWLRVGTGAELSRLMLERLVVAAKTGRAGSKVDVDAAYWLWIGRATLALGKRER